jgi:hypothetical protein
MRRRHASRARGLVVGKLIAHSPMSRYMYEVRTPEIERTTSIDTHRPDRRYHPHSERMCGRRGVSIDGVAFVVLILIPYGTDKQRVRIC